MKICVMYSGGLDSLITLRESIRMGNETIAFHMRRGGWCGTPEFKTVTDVSRKLKIELYVEKQPKWYDLDKNLFNRNYLIMERLLPTLEFYRDIDEVWIGEEKNSPVDRIRYKKQNLSEEKIWGTTEEKIKNWNDSHSYLKN